MTINLSNEITEKSKENAIFMYETLEKHLEELLKQGILLSDIHLGYSNDYIKIYVKNILKTKFTFSSSIERKNDRFDFVTNCTQIDY
jgi:hypothetical protein